MKDKSAVGLLDPMEEFTQEVQEGNTAEGRFADATMSLLEHQTKILVTVSDVIRGLEADHGKDTELSRKTIEGIIKMAAQVLQGFDEIRKALEAPEGEGLREVFPDLEKIVSDPVISKIGPAQIGLMGSYVQEVLPYILGELESKGTDRISIADFFGITGDDIDLDSSVYLKCLRLADEADRERAAGTLPKITEAIQCLAPVNSHTMPNNALMNALQQKSPINAGAFDLVVANETKKRKEITSYTVVTYDTSGPEMLASNMTEYERQVSDAVVTLWEAAKEQGVPPIFTTDMIHRAMPGGGDKPSPQQRGAITKAMEKLRHLHVTVDATEEMRQRGHIEKGETLEFDDFYLSAARVRKRFTNRKDEVSAYELHAEPLILNYANRTNQVIRTSAKFLEIRKVRDGHPAEIMTMSADRQAMTGYMLRRILVMKNDKNKAREALKNHNKRRKREPDLEERSLESFFVHSRIILFDTLFKEAGAAADDKTQNKRNRDFCLDVLEYWRVSGLIKGYTTQNKGRSITGVIIDL